MRLLDRNRMLPVMVFAVATLLVASTAWSRSKKKEVEGPAEMTHDGLHLVPGTEVAAAWVKPGADFGDYDRIMLLEPYVAFRKDWVDEQRRNSVNRISPRDVERMKTDLTELFREVFVDVLDSEGGYPVVNEANLDVLLVRPAIIDLDVTAPDLPSAGRSYNFAASAGAATLFLELYDSVSGEILARAIDRKADDRRGGVMQWTNSGTNRAAAKKALAEWANLLRQRLDEIHGKPQE